MSQILENVRNVDPNDSNAVKEVVTAFFQNLPKHTEVNCHIWLRGLETVINRYPRYCGQHRGTIENHVAHFIDSPNYYNVIEAAKCGHALQQIRPSQDKAATAKNCWREQMAILCNAAHKLIEAVFSKTINIYKDSKHVTNLSTNALSNTPLTKALSQVLNVKKSQNANAEDRNEALCIRLRNVFVFIQAMLVEVYPVAKPIRPQIIFQVILQALSFSSSVNTDVVQATMIKTEALTTIDAMILCLGQNLMPFSALVFRCVMQTLKWSSDNPSDESRKARSIAYKTLKRWLSILHVHRFSSDGKNRSWEDEITKHIIADITPPQKVVELTMSNQPMRNLSKKARKKLANSMLHQSSISSYMPGEKNKSTVTDEVNDDVANAALELTETLLTACGIFLQPATHKLFHEILVRECFKLQNYSPARSLRLLRALDGCRKGVPPSVAPPTQYCLQLYSTVVYSRCDEIRKFASEALLDIKLHLHNSPPSLNFALEAPKPTEVNHFTLETERQVDIDELNAAVERRKDLQKNLDMKRVAGLQEEMQLSEHRRAVNKAALDTLLGRDRHREKEMINIADEPINKRPRFDSSVAVNISLSSSDDDSDDVIEVDVSVESQSDLDLNKGNEEITENVQVNGSEESKEINNDIEILDENNVNENIKMDDCNVDTNNKDSNVSENNAIINNEDINKNNSLPVKSLPEITITIVNIHDVNTQIPGDTPAASVDGDTSPVSMEIVYDSNTTDKVNVLEKMDDENLPSTNDTDDIQITCGQAIQRSQDNEPEINKEVQDIPKVNEKNEGDNENKNEKVENVAPKETTIDDMLADFVDEVDDESKVEA